MHISSSAPVVHKGCALSCHITCVPSVMVCLTCTVWDMLRAIPTFCISRMHRLHDFAYSYNPGQKYMVHLENLLCLEGEGTVKLSKKAKCTITFDQDCRLLYVIYAEILYALKCNPLNPIWIFTWSLRSWAVLETIFWYGSTTCCWILTKKTMELKWRTKKEWWMRIVTVVPVHSVRTFRLKTSMN